MIFLRIFDFYIEWTTPEENVGDRVLFDERKNSSMPLQNRRTLKLRTEISPCH